MQKSKAMQKKQSNAEKAKQCRKGKAMRKKQSNAEKAKQCRKDGRGGGIMWQEAAFFLILTVLAYQDYKEKKVSLSLIMISGAVVGAMQIMTGDYEVFDLFAGMGIGAAVCLVSAAAKGKIGMGDGFVIALGGLMIGFEQNLSLCVTAIYLAGAAALLLFIIRKKGRNYRMPFVPFLWTAYVIKLLWSV